VAGILEEAIDAQYRAEVLKEGSAAVGSETAVASAGIRPVGSDVRWVSLAVLADSPERPNGKFSPGEAAELGDIR